VSGAVSRRARLSLGASSTGESVASSPSTTSKALSARAVPWRPRRGFPGLGQLDLQAKKVRLEQLAGVKPGLGCRDGSFVGLYPFFNGSERLPGFPDIEDGPHHLGGEFVARRVKIVIGGLASRREA